jgi:hypothetical protein
LTLTLTSVEIRRNQLNVDDFQNAALPKLDSTQKRSRPEWPGAPHLFRYYRGERDSN